MIICKHCKQENPAIFRDYMESTYLKGYGIAEEVSGYVGFIEEDCEAVNSEFNHHITYGCSECGRTSEYLYELLEVVNG